MLLITINCCCNFSAYFFGFFGIVTLSIFILMAGALFFGLFMPESVENVFNSIVAILSGGTP